MKVTPPSCADCGGPSRHVVSVAAKHRGSGSDAWAHVWLCGSCEFRREHPDAAPRTLMPNERRAKAKQRETLFESDPP